VATYHHRNNSTGGTQNGDGVIVIRFGEINTVYFQDLVSRSKSTLSWPVGIHLRHDYSLQKGYISVFNARIKLDIEINTYIILLLTVSAPATPPAMLKPRPGFFFI